MNWYNNSLIAFLLSKCNFIQHFKLDKNRNWAINFVLRSKNKNWKMCKNWKIRTRTSGEGVVLEIRTRGGGGWFENPRFWRTSFVDGPLVSEFPKPPPPRTSASGFLILNFYTFFNFYFCSLKQSLLPNSCFIKFKMLNTTSWHTPF